MPALAGLAGFFAAVAATLAGLADSAAGFLGAPCFAAGSFVADAFFAAGTACFAAGAFFAAGLDAAGVALATGFFTMAGSFDELERAFVTGISLPWEPLRIQSRAGSTLCHQGVLASGEPGFIPPNAAWAARHPLRKPHFAPRSETWLSEQARDCIENSTAGAMCLQSKMALPFRTAPFFDAAPAVQCRTRAPRPFRPGTAPAPAPGSRAAARCR